MTRYLLTFSSLFIVVFLCGCQGALNPGNQQGGLFGRPSGTFAGSWNGGWNRNWNGPRGTPYRPSSGPSGGLFSGLNRQSDPGALRADSERDREIARLNTQIREMQGRLGGFDTDNNGLHAEIASLKQQLQRSGNLNGQLKQQLGDMAANVQQLQQLKGRYEQELVQAKTQQEQLIAQNRNRVPSQLTGTATIRANNSLLQKLPQIQVDGVETRMDGDVIRVEIPSDRVFVPGTYQISNQANYVLNSLATAISQNFPNQYIGIEAHWDQAILNGGLTAHQLTATQALSVSNQLSSSGLAKRQLFNVAMANNRPRYQGNNSRNRRIEIVIYPETIRR